MDPKRRKTGDQDISALRLASRVRAVAAVIPAATSLACGRPAGPPAIPNTPAGRALRAWLDLAGITSRVLNAVYLSPLDMDAIADAARGTRAIVTAEEANLAGGLGAAVAMVCCGSLQSVSQIS